jgi:hypothetical protein
MRRVRDGRYNVQCECSFQVVESQNETEIEVGKLGTSVKDGAIRMRLKKLFSVE